MKLKYLYIPFSLTLIIAICLRFYQCVYCVDESWKTVRESNFITYLVSILLLFSTIIMLLLTHFCKEYSRKYKLKRNIFAGIFSLLAGASLVYNSVYQYTSLELSKWSIMMYTIDALAGVVFIIMAFSAFTGANLLADLSLLALLPPLSVCMHLANVVFLTYPNLLELSLQIYRTLALIFAVLFLFIYAKLLSGYEAESTIKKAMVISLLCCISSTVYIVDIAYKLITRSEVDMLTVAPYPSYLLLALYSFCISIEIAMQSSATQEYNKGSMYFEEPDYYQPNVTKEYYEKPLNNNHENTSTPLNSYPSHNTNTLQDDEPKSEFYESLFLNKNKQDEDVVYHNGTYGKNGEYLQEEPNFASTNENKVPKVEKQEEIRAKRMLPDDNNKSADTQENISNLKFKNIDKPKINKKNTPDIDQMVDDILKGLF